MQHAKPFIKWVGGKSQLILNMTHQTMICLMFTYK